MPFDNGNTRGTLVLFAGCLAATLLLALTALYPPYELSPSAQGCRMSWMSPSYILQQPRLNTSWAVAGRYRLWLYREVGWDGDKPLGTPVLFIPGNAGSFKQVRSIASSATRQYWSQPYVRSDEFSKNARPLDFFALDTNEELSAWDAATLSAQASYAAAVVPYILSLYAHQHDPPKDVIIIGHSMGGIVARAMLESRPRPAVTTVLSLSTPHAFPPLPISRSLERLYKSGPVPDDVLFLSLCGGSQDVEFPAELCSQWQGSNTNWTRWSTGIEQVWTGVGHREMVWCHQVRWRVARAALELAALSTVEKKEVIVERWFGTSRPEQYGHHSSPGLGDLSSIEEASFSISNPLTSHGYILPALPDLADVLIMHPLSLNIESQICTSIDSCDAAIVTHRRLLPQPPADQPFPRPGEGIGEEEAIVVSTLRPHPSKQLIVRTLDGPGWLSGEPLNSNFVEEASAMWKAFTFGITVNPSSKARRAIYTMIGFTRLQEDALLVYQATLDAAPDCAHSSGVSPILSSRPPETFFHPHAASSVSHFTSHVSAAPFIRGHTSYLTLELWNPAKCDIKGIRVRVDLWASLGRIFGRYRVVLVAWSLGVTGILNTIAYSAWDAGAPFPSVLQALSYYTRNTMPTLCIVLFLASLIPLPQQWLLGNSGLPYLAPLGPLLLLVSTFLVALSWLVIRLVLSVAVLGMRMVRLQTRAAVSVRLGLQHYVSIGIFCLILILLVPSHFVFLVAFLVQLVTTSRCFHIVGGLPPRLTASMAETHLAQCSHLLLMLFWLLPLTAPFAIVWIRTLVSRGLSALLTTDYDLLAVVCVILSIESASAGRVWTRSTTSWQKWGTRALLVALSSYCFLLGGRYTYGIYEWVELYFCAALIRSSKRGGGSDAVSEGSPN